MCSLAQGHAEKLDSAKEHVDAPETVAPKHPQKSYGKQMADWQRQQLELEKDYRTKMKSQKMMAKSIAPRGTVENVHPLMSKVSPHINFSTN